MLLKETDEAITELILQESKVLETILNKNLLLNFGNRHNIADEFNMFSLKQEVVAKKAYFLDVKKKYALHITNNEGVPVDTMYIRGMVTRRSDYSTFTKTNIMKIINMLVKDEVLSFEKIRDFVDVTRNQYIKLCVEGKKEIAKPVSYSKAEYKRVPPHIIGMELWNDCMYNHFVPGTKGCMFKISGIDSFKAPERVRKVCYKYEKYNTVVLPYEEEALPDFFKIDLNAMIKLHWDDRVKEILSPIWNKVYKDKIAQESIMTWE